jgi:hypothetical protein
VIGVSFFFFFFFKKERKKERKKDWFPHQSIAITRKIKHFDKKANENKQQNQQYS